LDVQTRYVAYGLELLSSFPLPGMSPAGGPGLPQLALTRGSSHELAAAWGGHEDGSLWTGALGHGLALSVQRGHGGEVMFICRDASAERGHQERVRFRLRAEQDVLECAPRGQFLKAEEQVAWQRVLLDKVLRCVSMIRGYEALHASAVDSPGGVVAFLGAGGAGKTTLALEFMRRGWPLFGDEVLTLGERSAGVSAFRGTPHMSIAARPLSSAQQPEPGARITRSAPARTAQLRILASEHGERWVAAPIAGRVPRPVRALCLLERGTGRALEARVLDASVPSLEPYILGSWGGDIRQRDRSHLYADLASSTTLISVSAGLDEPPAALADAVEAALAQRSMLGKSAA
jgi:hypothetical protein